MNLWASFKAFLDSPLKFINDPANTTIEYQTREALTSGMSKEEVQAALVGQGFKKGSPVRDIANGVIKGVEFLVNNIHVVLILGIGLVVFYYLMPILKRK